MSEHTPERWYRNDLIAGQGSVILAGASHRKRLDIDGRFTKEDARRIVACVNACRGMDTKWLEEFSEFAASGPPLVNLWNNAALYRDQLGNVSRERDEAVEAMAAMSLRIIELQAQLEVSAMEATRQAVAATTAVKERDEARAMVKRLAVIVKNEEWTPWDGTEDPVWCRACHGTVRTGHMPDCGKASALAKAEALHD